MCLFVLHRVWWGTINLLQISICIALCLVRYYRSIPSVDLCCVVSGEVRGQPVSALTLSRKAPDRVATGAA